MSNRNTPTGLADLDDIGRGSANLAWMDLARLSGAPRTPRIGETIFAQAVIENHEGRGCLATFAQIVDERQNPGCASIYFVRDYQNGRIYKTYRSDMRRASPPTTTETSQMFHHGEDGASRLLTHQEKTEFLIRAAILDRAEGRAS